MGWEGCRPQPKLTLRLVRVKMKDFRNHGSCILPHAASPPRPVVPSLEDLPIPADIVDDDIRTVIIPLPQFSTLNGLIR